VPLIRSTSLLPGDAEWLARRRAGPDLAFVRPSSEATGECTSADAGEEVVLGVPEQVDRVDIRDAPFIHVARRNAAGGDEVAQPLRSLRVELVVIGGAHCAWINSRA
jgi:hypothetical protein